MAMEETHKNIILLMVTLALMLGAAEVAARVRVFLKHKAAYQNRAIVLDKIAKGVLSEHEDAFGPMIRFSDNERIAFELKPDFTWNFVGQEVRTSSEGFRDREYSIAKPPGTVRIFGIGDSVMFGQGVRQGNEYLSILEGLLNVRYDGTKWEAINSGVPEYNTFIELETLKAKGLKFEPDIVVLGFVLNDINVPKVVAFLGLPEKMDIMGRYMTLTDSYLLRFIRHRLDGAVMESPPLENKYEEFGGGNMLASSLGQLKQMSLERGFDVVVLFLTDEKHPVDKEFMRIARTLGFHIVDMEPVIQEYMRAEGIESYRDSFLVVSDGHPSETTHALTARALLKHMEQSGLIEKHLRGGGQQ